MFRGGRRAKVARGRGSPLVAPEQVVRTAEAIVGRAWGQELLRRREQMDRAVVDAFATAEQAWRDLADAQRGGDAPTITAAQADLERALETASTSVIERDRGIHALAAHLEALRRATEERLQAALNRRPAPRRAGDRDGAGSTRSPGRGR